MLVCCQNPCNVSHSLAVYSVFLSSSFGCISIPSSLIMSHPFDPSAAEVLKNNPICQTELLTAARVSAHFRSALLQQEISCHWAHPWLLAIPCRGNLGERRSSPKSAVLRQGVWRRPGASCFSGQACHWRHGEEHRGQVGGLGNPRGETSTKGLGKLRDLSAAACTCPTASSRAAQDPRGEYAKGNCRSWKAVSCQSLINRVQHALHSASLMSLVGSGVILCGNSVGLCFGLSYSSGRCCLMVSPLSLYFGLMVLGLILLLCFVLMKVCHCCHIRPKSVSLCAVVSFATFLFLFSVLLNGWLPSTPKCLQYKKNSCEELIS